MDDKQALLVYSSTKISPEKLVEIISDLGFEVSLTTNILDPLPGRAVSKSYISSDQTSASEVRRQSISFSALNSELISQFLYSLPGIIFVSTFVNENRIEVWTLSNGITGEGKSFA